MERKKIVLDKSYLFKASTNQLIALSEEFDFLITRMLVYEILSDTKGHKVYHLFEKLRYIAEHCYYVPHVGQFLSNEKKYFKPVKTIILHDETRRLQSALIRGDYHIEAARRKIEPEKKNEDSNALWQISIYKYVIEGFPELKELKKGIERSEALRFFLIICDAERFMKFLGDFIRHENINIPLKRFSSKWIWFRYLQYEFLTDVELIRLYGLNESNPNLKKVTNLKFDLHYAVFASFVDGLATCDNELEFFFRIATPDKMVIVK